MKLLDTTYKLFPKDKAIAIAAELQADDEDWTYTPVHCPNGTGFSFIDIHDEDNEFVARF